MNDLGIDKDSLVFEGLQSFQRDSPYTFHLHKKLKNINPSSPMNTMIIFTTLQPQSTLSHDQWNTIIWTREVLEGLLKMPNSSLFSHKETANVPPCYFYVLSFISQGTLLMISQKILFFWRLCQGEMK